MSRAHSEIVPELRQLAQAILDRIDPAVRAAAALTGGGESPGKCQQVWCPVCALAALASDEQHPLLDVIAEHSVALLTFVRALLDSSDTSEPPPSDGGPDGHPDGHPDGNPDGNGAVRRSPNRYQHIPIRVDE